MRFSRTLFALAASLFLAPLAIASDPPAAFLPDPPAAKVEAAPDVSGACVRVSTASGRGFEFSGGGTCIWSDESESIVLTNNHIFSERNHPDGGFYDDVYPQKATVQVGGKAFKATALTADRLADIAIVLVEGRITSAPIASTMPKPGEMVWRNGMGSGLQKCKVVAAEVTADRFGFNVVGKSESGDSGSGYFNSQNELVAVHCGKNTVNQPRGTPITVATVVVKNRTPLLFPRLRDRLASRSSTPPMFLPEPPAALPKAPTPKKVAAGCICDPDCKCKDGDCPSKCPIAKSLPPCGPNGCPLSSRYGSSPSCSGGSCGTPARTGWYPGKLLGRR